jgi:hypothetical protein
MLRVVSLLLLLSVLACTPDDDGEPPVDVLQCASEGPCGFVEAPKHGEQDPEPTAYSNSQRCALEAMRDAETTPVRIDWGGCASECFNCEAKWCSGLLLAARANGKVLVQKWWGDSALPPGLDVSYEPFAVVCEIKPRSYFEDCLANFDVSCAQANNWVTDCTIPTSTCDPSR